MKERNNVNYLANKKLIHIWFYSSENIDLFPFSTSSVLHQLEHTVLKIKYCTGNWNTVGSKKGNVSKISHETLIYGSLLVRRE